MSEGVTVVTGAVEGFDYTALDSETRIVVQQRTGEIRSLVRRSAQDVVDIGVKLGEVKQKLGHGGFGRWLEAEFQWSDSAAQKFMAVANRFKSVNFTDLTVAPSALYLLAAPSTPEEAVDEALERAAGGERITHAAARGIVDGYRPPVGRVDGMDGVDGDGPRPSKKLATLGRIEGIVFDYIRVHFVTNEKAYPFLSHASEYTVSVLMQSIHARGEDCDRETLLKAIDAVAQRIAPTETEEELRQRIRETDRRWKDEINGRFAAQAGPVLPPVELMPIEGWELEEFVERVAGEVYGESAPRSERAWNAMTVSARSMTGEFWAKLRRTLAPFDVVDGRLQVAVYELVKGWKEASGENGQRSTGNGDLSTAPSAEARRFGQEVKAATWGGVQRDDRPMVTAEGLANSLRGWAANVETARLRTAAEYRGGSVWFEARQIVSGLNYRDKELVAALGMLAEEGEGERGGEGEEENGQLSTVNGQLSMEERDPWVAACGRVQSRQKTAEALAVAIMPWIEAYQDKYGRGWREIAERGNPAHTNSVLWDDIGKEAKRRQLVVDDLTFKAAIKQAFSWLGASDNPLLSDGGEEEESHEDAKALRGHEEEEAELGLGDPAGADAVPVSQRDGYDSDEWYTPRWVIEAARKVMGEIDLDPASCALAQEVVQAGLFWSKQQGGERLGWFGRLWLNPPYSAPALFVEKLLAEYTSGNVKQAVVLLNNATETGWFQALLARFPVCFLSKRLAFWRHDHADVGARQGQAVFYLGPDVERFCEVFGEFGIVVRRVD